VKPSIHQLRRLLPVVVAAVTTVDLVAQTSASRPTPAELVPFGCALNSPADPSSLAEKTTAVPTAADRASGTWTLTYGPYNRHTGRGNYNCHPHFTGLEWGRPNHWALGASYFINSFSQSCWFTHASRSFTFTDSSDGVFVKIACGIIYGYRPPHEDSVPLNIRGFNPAIIPSAGYKWKHTALHLAIYGKNAGQMLLFSHEFR
jgi:hypothetical protein